MSLFFVLLWKISFCCRSYFNYSSLWISFFFFFVCLFCFVQDLSLFFKKNDFPIYCNSFKFLSIPFIYLLCERSLCFLVVFVFVFFKKMLNWRSLFWTLFISWQKTITIWDLSSPYHLFRIYRKEFTKKIFFFEIVIQKTTQKLEMFTKKTLKTKMR